MQNGLGNIKKQWIRLKSITFRLIANLLIQLKFALNL